MICICEGSKNVHAYDRICFEFDSVVVYFGHCGIHCHQFYRSRTDFLKITVVWSFRELHGTERKVLFIHYWTSRRTGFVFLLFPVLVQTLSWCVVGSCSLSPSTRCVVLDNVSLCRWIDWTQSMRRRLNEREMHVDMSFINEYKTNKTIVDETNHSTELM